MKESDFLKRQTLSHCFNSAIFSTVYEQKELRVYFVIAYCIMQDFY